MSPEFIAIFEQIFAAQKERLVDAGAPDDEDLVDYLENTAMHDVIWTAAYAHYKIAYPEQVAQEEAQRARNREEYIRANGRDGYIQMSERFCAGDEELEIPFVLKGGKGLPS